MKAQKEELEQEKFGIEDMEIDVSNQEMVEMMEKRRQGGKKLPSHLKFENDDDDDDDEELLFKDGDNDAFEGDNSGVNDDVTYTVKKSKKSVKNTFQRPEVDV